MNYTKHYDSLIERAKGRTLTNYKEKHHIIPRCLGGNNKKANLVYLTAEEHYVAHQLLVKINPGHLGLIRAANMMTCSAKNNKRCNNRTYSWLRKKHAIAMSDSQTGTGNSQFGTCWVTNINDAKSKKIKKDELQHYLDLHWVKGRNKKMVDCIQCGTPFIPLTREKSCSKLCLDTFRSALSKKSQTNIQASLAKRYGKDYRKVLGKKGGLSKN